MSLLHLFQKTEYTILVAHCNFSLRGEDSDGDQAMIRKYCESHKIAFETVKFDTAKEAEMAGVSTQMIARSLRYDWFNELKQKLDLGFVATAHHSGDSLETALLNLTRGTGIKGLKGILPLKNELLRPLLFTNKETIRAYAEKEQIPYREDSSNASDKYHRNFIRHKVMPLLESINPNLRVGFLQTSERVAKALDFIEQKTEKFKKAYILKENGFDKILQKDFFEPENRVPLEFWLDELGFNYDTVNAIFKEEVRISGKQFKSPTHQLTFDRESILVNVLSSIDDIRIEISMEETAIDTKFGVLKLKVIDEFPPLESLKMQCKAYLDFSKLKFPLILRNWRKGDRFKPFGMKHSKLISDFLIDQKIALPVKEKTMVICSDNEIIWVVGYRISDNYKVNKSCSKLLELTYTSLK